MKMTDSSRTARPSQAKGGKRARTKAKLLEAAASVIAEKGLDRSSLADIAARADMTRGAVYGNFKNKDELFLALIAEYWRPIIPRVKAGMSLKQQMRVLGQTVAEEARKRKQFAAAATAFQLYILTHKSMQDKVVRQNARMYRQMAAFLLTMVSEKDLPMPAERFIRVVDALISGLLFTYFQTPTLITDEVFVSAFEALI
jgi:AcrR family transcriptional regulator